MLSNKITKSSFNKYGIFSFPHQNNHKSKVIEYKKKKRNVNVITNTH